MYSKQTRKNIRAQLTPSEIRRKRAEKQQTLRKKMFLEKLRKRRKELTEDDYDEDYINQLKQIPKLVQKIHSNNIQEQLEATSAFRKMLSTEKSPPINQVIEVGIVDTLVGFLKRKECQELQFEASWALTNIASGTSDHTKYVVNAGAIPYFVKLLSSSNEDVREQSVWALGNISGDSPKLRDKVLEYDVIKPLNWIITSKPKTSILRNATWTLSNLCRGKPIPKFELLKDALPVLSFLLYNTDEEVLTDASWAISYLSDGPNDRIEAVVKTNVTRRLVELLSHQQPAVQTPALRTIGNIVTGNDEQTQKVINVGALDCLRTLLGHKKKSIRKETCWTISNITAGNENQIEAIISHNIIPPLVKILKEDEFDVKKEAAWAISNATSGGSDNQISFLVKQGCIKPLCDLLKRNDEKVINVALEGIQNILETGKRISQNENENIFSDFIEEAGGIDKIENLQFHKSPQIFTKVKDILEEYFEAYEESDEEEQDENLGDQFVFGGDSSGNSFNFNSNQNQNQNPF